jgi:hypothetical protein
MAARTSGMRGIAHGSVRASKVAISCTRNSSVSIHAWLVDGVAARSASAPNVLEACAATTARAS